MTTRMRASFQRVSNLMKILRTRKVSQSNRLIPHRVEIGNPWIQKKLEPRKVSPFPWTARTRGMKEERALRKRGPDGDRLLTLAFV